MIVRVKLVGSGIDGDPYRANLPNYSNVLTLIDSGVVYANIPETEHPGLDQHSSAKFEKTGHGDVLIGLDADGHKKWYAHLDERYAENKGKYRPEIA